MVYIPSSIDLVWLPYNAIASVEISCSTISISTVVGLKYVLDIIIFWSGCPMNGVAFGLFVGDDDGDKVQNIKFVDDSTYLYLIDFWLVLVKFSTTGSQ